MPQSSMPQSSRPTSALSSVRSSFQAIVHWWRQFFATPLDVRDPEAAKIAADVGLTVSDLARISHLGAGSADPMVRRMASLGLSEDEVSRTEPAVFHDLQRVCSFCDSKKKCQHEIKRDPNNGAWKSYCPNMPTFEGLLPHG